MKWFTSTFSYWTELASEAQFLKWPPHFLSGLYAPIASAMLRMR